MLAAGAAPMWELDRLVKYTGAPVIGSVMPADTAILTTASNGLPPAFLGIWGGVDMIRDPYTDAQSGGLRLTGLLTADVTVARGAQIRLITGIGASE